MIIKRRKLGPPYTRSPAQNIQEAITANFAKFLFAIFCSILSLGVLFGIVAIINFLGNHFYENWGEETTALQLFNSPYCLPWKVITVIGTFLYVMKDNLTKR